jgi:hypothetical protein
MSIGDINSKEIGSGARFNTGKAPLDLIPLWIIAAVEYSEHVPSEFTDPVTAMLHLSDFQLRLTNETKSPDISHLVNAVLAIGPAWEECAAVFSYGRSKYAAWNWAKGMPWSAVIASAARHLLAMLRGEEKDAESGLSHRGHFLCNVVMLLSYLDSYPAGDDRPEAKLFASKVGATPDVREEEAEALVQAYEALLSSDS